MVKFAPYDRIMQKSKTREITIVEEGGSFHPLFRKSSSDKSEFDFEGLSALRKILSNERARLLHVLKTNKPESIYSLAKILKRDFKSVNQDIKLLERFGFIDLISEKTGNRERLRPIVVIDSLHLIINL